MKYGERNFKIASINMDNLWNRQTHTHIGREMKWSISLMSYETHLEDISHFGMNLPLSKIDASVGTHSLVWILALGAFFTVSNISGASGPFAGDVTDRT